MYKRTCLHARLYHWLNARCLYYIVLNSNQEKKIWTFPFSTYQMCFRMLTFSFLYISFIWKSTFRNTYNKKRSIKILAFWSLMYDLLGKIWEKKIGKVMGQTPLYANEVFWRITFFASLCFRGYVCCFEFPFFFLYWFQLALICRNKHPKLSSICANFMMMVTCIYVENDTCN